MWGSDIPHIPQPTRPVDQRARLIPGLLRSAFDDAEAAMEAKLQAVTLAALKERLTAG